MDNRPIGFFDSGVGGLTAVSALRQILPDENIIYFADTARCPYGTRSVDELRIMAKENLDLLKRYDVKAILAACGTMSANATDILDGYEIKTFNVLYPAVNAMASNKGTGALAVLATNASIESGVFQKKIREATDRQVYGIACQEFVRLCENGQTDEKDGELMDVIDGYLNDIRGKVDAILLGCTHFGLIEKAISAYMPEVEIISAAKEAAKVLADYLISNSLTGGEGAEKIICSGYNIC